MVAEGEKVNNIRIVDNFTFPMAVNLLLDIVVCEGGERLEAIEGAKRKLIKFEYLDKNGKPTKKAWENPKCY